MSTSDFRQKKVLDLGCGPRGSLQFLKEQNAQLVCVDPLDGDTGSPILISWMALHTI